MRGSVRWVSCEVQRRARSIRALSIALSIGCLACGEPDGSSEDAEVIASVNGCDRATAVDARGEAEVEIRFGDLLGYAYEPRCVVVGVGTEIHFRGDYLSHPVAPGRVVEGLPPPHADNPIRETNAGSLASFTASAAGSFGYYCNVHLAEGMMGAVFVE